MKPDLEAAIARLRGARIDQLLPLDERLRGEKARDRVCDACEQQAQEIARLTEANDSLASIWQPEIDRLHEAIEGHIRGNATLCVTAAKNLERAEKAEAEVARLTALAREALPYLEAHDDKGPRYEGWQSDELIHLIVSLRELIRPDVGALRERK